MTTRPPEHVLVAAALCLVLGALPGCASQAMMVTGIVAPNDIAELETQQRALTPRYEARVAAFQQEIDALKASVNSSLEAKDLMASARSLRALYELTHPCGEEGCDTYPCDDVCSKEERSRENLEPLNKAEVFIEREGVDDEEGFIRSSMNTLLEQGREAFEAGEHEVVNTMVDHLNANLPLSSRTKRGYSELTFDTKKALIDTIVAEAAAAEATDPLSASTGYSRASKLSAELGEDRQAADYEAKAASLRGGTNR